MPNSLSDLGGSSASFIDPRSDFEIIDFINKGIAYAIIVAGILSVIFIFVGGISFILSGGKEEKIKEAIGTIRYAIIGLVVTILAVIIVNTVGKIVGLDTIKYINFGEIIDLIGEISDDIRGSSRDTLD